MPCVFGLRYFKHHTSTLTMTFTEKLRSTQEPTQSVVCVGLAPDLQKMPANLFSQFYQERAVYRFLAEIIAATRDIASAYKPNWAFFEVLGVHGWRVLQKVLSEIPRDKIVIADAKRGDIGNTARMYAEAVFTQFNCDAITVNPYMGADSVAPFLAYPNRAAFVLGLTSNAGAADFEQLPVQVGHASMPLFQVVAQKVAEWGGSAKGTAGLVVGATQAADLLGLRGALPGMPFLIPGVGAQGGNAQSAMQAGRSGPVIINASRNILYASAGIDFADAAAHAAKTMRDELNRFRK